MAILSIDTSQTGQVSVLPSYASINTSDTEATVLTTGYLNKEVANGASFNLPCIAKVSTVASPGAAPKVGWYNVSHSGSDWSLTSVTSPGSVTLPTIPNHFIASTDVNGTLANITGTMIQAGSIQAGLSGTAGTLISYPGTALKGSFVFAAVANTGNTVTTFSNNAMGQTTAVNVPDPGNPIGQVLIAATATPFVNGNFPVNSGTAGKMVDSGVAAAQLMQLNAVNTLTGSGQIILVKANASESGNAVTASGNAGVITTSSLTTAGGSSYAITWTNTKITSTSVILLTIMGGTNTVENITLKATAGSGTSTLTIYNNTAATPLNGTILIGYTVL